MKKNGKLKRKLGTGLSLLSAAISIMMMVPSAAMAARPISVYTIFDADDHITHDRTSGSLTQGLMSNDMLPVVCFAEPGYYFKDDYSASLTIDYDSKPDVTTTMVFGAETYGFLCTKISAREIQLSGTAPSDITEVTIALGAATKKAAGNSLPSSMREGMGRIPSTTDAMEYTPAPLTPASTWRSCIDHGTPVIAGTYLVRYKETDTTAAGDPLQVDVYPVISFAADPSLSHLKHTDGSLTPKGFSNYELTAEDGYYIPDDYSVQLKSGGVSQTLVEGTETYGMMIFLKNSRSFLLNTGSTGTKDVTITLTPAAEKGQQAAPTVSGGAEKILGTTPAMEYASDPNAADGGWLVCSDVETDAAPGVWYVRYRETDTLKAGDAVKVTVTGAVVPGTYTVTVQNGTLGAAPGQGGGSGSYRAGDTVTVTALTPAAGSSFREWRVTAGTVTLQDKNSATTSFLMPDEDVALEAVYEGGAPEPGPGTEPEEEPEAEPQWEFHEHRYEWVVEYPATAASDGREKYQCAVCSSVLHRRSISGQTAFVNELLNTIQGAAAGEPGQTLEIDTTVWMSYPKSVLLELDKAGMALKTTFRYQGKIYSFLIPAGQAAELLTEEENFYGFLYLSDHYGRTLVE